MRLRKLALAAPSRQDHLADRGGVRVERQDRSAPSTPALVVGVRDQEHHRQPRLVELLQDRVTQAMQAPGDHHRVGLTRLDYLEELIGRQTLRDHNQVVGGIQRRPQALLQLLVAQAQRQPQSRQLVHAQWIPVLTSRMRNLRWRQAVKRRARPCAWPRPAGAPGRR